MYQLIFLFNWMSEAEKQSLFLPSSLYSVSYYVLHFLWSAGIQLQTQTVGCLKIAQLEDSDRDFFCLLFLDPCLSWVLQTSVSPAAWNLGVTYDKQVPVHYWEHPVKPPRRRALGSILSTRFYAHSAGRGYMIRCVLIGGFHLLTIFFSESCKMWIFI